MEEEIANSETSVVDCSYEPMLLYGAATNGRREHWRNIMVVRFFNGPAKASKLLFNSARARVEQAIGRFDRRVNNVEVRIAEIASGKPGAHHGRMDKRCVIAATASGAGVIVVESSGEDLYSAVNTAAAKLKRALERRLARKPR